MSSGVFLFLYKILELKKCNLGQQTIILTIYYSADYLLDYSDLVQCGSSNNLQSKDYIIYKTHYMQVWLKYKNQPKKIKTLWLMYK